MNGTEDTSWAGVDVQAGWALLLVEHPYGDDASVTRWGKVLADAYVDGVQAADYEWQGRDDLPGLRGRIEEFAARELFDAAAVRIFLEGMDLHGNPYDLIKLVIGYDDQLPGLYWRLHRYQWLDEPQRQRVAALFGADWPDGLSRQLDAAWGANWEARSARDKAAWLADLLPSWEQPSADSAAVNQAGPVDPLGWVTTAQQAAAQSLWGTGWRDRLPGLLDVRWGADWQAKPPDHKAAWFDAFMQETRAIRDALGIPRERDAAIQWLLDEAFSRRPDLAKFPLERLRELAAMAVDARQ